MLNSHVALKLKCLGPTGHAVGHVEFQRQRADIADGQTLTTSQHNYIIITPRAALAEQCTACDVTPRNGQFRHGLAKTITSGGGLV